MSTRRGRAIRGVPARGAETRTPLIGRDEELAELLSLVRPVAAGQGAIVVVSGEAGIGKTRLITQVLDTLATENVQVFAGVGDELGRQRPFGIVLDALVDADDDSSLRGELSVAEQQLGLESRLARLLVGLLRAASDVGPVALLLDDLQWADESSLLAIKQLARLTADRPVVLICAYRPYPATQALQALVASLDYLGAHHLRLDGLSEAAAEQFASTLAGAPLVDSLRAAVERAAGNPFFVEAIVALVGHDEPSVNAPSAGSTGWVPPMLRATVLGGLRFLPPETFDTLRAAAIVGRRFTVGEIALIAPGRVADLVAALEPALRASVLEADSDGERLAFRHDLIREAIYDDLTPALRSALHNELAAKLAELSAPGERIAAQLMLGAHPGDRAAIERLRTAAAEILGASPATAADVLWRALELATGLPSARMTVLVDLVRPLMWTGQGERAEQVCQEALGRV